MTELVVSPAQHVDDESQVGDGGATVIEGVSELLEVATVLTNGHVALEEAMELLLCVDGALKAIV